ncbi:unnamed protein product [Rangifer tarandus platyrhynchus]|uniref:Uncharacterized protein n=1 Tax=Rangifer tarandus platyrhynchus TaxID=3082113 RepID=A0ABN8ZVG7_RANTA|nr:unnamed protein product [Rangifer tarandus platyrhynchus]
MVTYEQVQGQDEDLRLQDSALGVGAEPLTRIRIRGFAVNGLFAAPPQPTRLLGGETMVGRNSAIAAGVCGALFIGLLYLLRPQETE